MRIISFILTFFSLAAHADDVEKSQYIFAASSLERLLPAIFDNEENATLVYGSSAVLARQIASGAPSDIYISASPEWADWLAENGGNIIERRVFLGNELALVTFAEHECVDSLDALAVIEPKTIAIGEPNGAPLGIYTKESLETLNVWAALSTSFIPAESARAAMRFVETGNVDFGILYASDAKSNKALKTCFFLPPKSHSPIQYEAILLNDATASKTLFDELFNAKSAEIIQDFGFQPIKSAPEKPKSTQ